MVHDKAWEYGYINGKLAALRWVLGDEWDFLDTLKRGVELRLDRSQIPAHNCGV